MSRLFCDSFDHYTTLADKGWSVSGVSSTSAVGRFGTNGVRLDGNFNYISRAITAGDVFIINIAFALKTQPASGNPVSVVGLFDGSDGQIYVLIDNTKRLILARGQPSGILNQSFTTLDTDSNVLVVGDYHYLEAKFTIGNSGSAVVKLDGTQIFNFSGDTQANGNASANGFIVGQISNNGGGIDIDDLIIMDDAGTTMNDFIGEKRVRVLLPQAEGNYSAWTPSTGADNAALVDEAAANGDTDYVSSANVGDKDTYTFANLPAGTIGIESVVVNHYARKDDGGTRKLKALLRSNGTDQLGADEHTMLSTFGIYQSGFDEDPDGPSAWDVSGVNAIEAGQELTA